MAPCEWGENDHAHLLQKIILLQMLNEVPEKPCENILAGFESREGMSPARSLTLQREKELAESFAFLAATTDDPRKIVAACVEEDEAKGSMTVRLAVNNGGVDKVKAGFEKMSAILKRATQRDASRASEDQHALLCEAVALNQNRILLRLRSRHAKSHSNFAKRKMQRPKLIPQLCETMDKPIVEKTARAPFPVFAALKDDVQGLGRLFKSLESLSTPKARSRPGLDIIINLVTTCHHIHDHHILEQSLTGASWLDPDLRATIARTVTKIGRYSSISKSLLQASRRNSIFGQVRVSIVSIRAPKLGATELDWKTEDFVDALMDKSRFQKFASKNINPSAATIEEYVRQEATLPVPVHAEVQLLFYYEWNPCSLPPRIICSSKQACFLCNLFFRIHGKFAVPSTHGRMYEKWALPAGIQNNEDPDGNVLTTCREFVSTIEGALQRELQSSRKSYPAPHESMILNSAIGSQSNSSRISAHDTLNRRKSGPRERQLSDSSHATRSPKRFHLIHTDEAAITTATAGKSQIDRRCSRSNTSSTLPARAPNPPIAVSQSIDAPNENTNSNPSYVLLTEGRPIWCEISATAPALKVRTPRVRLTVAQDETIPNELGPEWSHYWVLLEYLADRSIQDDQNVANVDLLSIPVGHNLTLDYDSSEAFRKLRVYEKGDVICVTYSLQKPVDGLEYGS